MGTDRVTVAELDVDPLEGYEPFSARVARGHSPIELDRALVRRFFDKTKIEGDHVIWIGGKQSNGIGMFSLRVCTADVRSVAWVLAQRGDLPANELPRSTCGRDDCVRPAHLALRPRQSGGGPKSIEQLTPKPLAKLAEAQRTPSALHDSLIEVSKGVQQLLTHSQRVGDEIRGVMAPTPEKMIAFLAQPGHAVITYKSGAAIVYVGTDQYYGDDWGSAVANAMRAAR